MYFNNSAKTFDDSKFAIISENLTFLKVSKYFAIFFGFIPEELEGKDIFQKMSFLNEKGINKETLQELLSQKFFYLEEIFDYPKKDGYKLSVVFFKIASTIVMQFFNHNETQYIGSNSNNITIQEIFNSISDMIVVVDSELKLITANVAFHSQFKSKIEIFKNAKYIDIQSLINMTFMDGKSHSNEYQLHFSHNSKHWFNIISFPIINLYKDIIAVVLSFRNIDASKKLLINMQKTFEQLEQQMNKQTKELYDLNERLKFEIDRRNKICNSLDESENFLSAFWDIVLAGVVIIDASTMVIVDVNLQAEKMVGLDKKDIVGKVCHTFICPAEKGACPIIDKSGIVDNSERILINKNGEQISIIKTVSQTTINGKPHLIETFLDNTERKKAQDLLKLHDENLKKIVEDKTNDLNESIQKLNETNEKLRNSEKRKGAFFDNITHELRTPLTGILGFATLLKEQHFGSLNQKQCAYVNQIEICGRHQMELINNLLEISKTEDEFFHMNARNCNLHYLIRNVLSFFEADILEKKQSLSMEFDINIKNLKIDVQKIRSVLSNIISNAVKFTKQYGHIKLKTELNDDVILVSIQDSGGGIKEEVKRKMFSKTYRLKNNNGNINKGMGIGLFLSKSFIELHGGEIWVESIEGVGSTFTFSIPKKLMIQ